MHIFMYDWSVLQNTCDLFPANLLKLIPRTRKSTGCFCNPESISGVFFCKCKKHKQLTFLN